jgi:hypothetical protein
LVPGEPVLEVLFFYVFEEVVVVIHLEVLEVLEVIHLEVLEAPVVED